MDVGFAAIWLLEVNDIRQAVTKEGSLTKTGWDRQARNGATRLEVRIEDDLNDGQKPAGLECAEEFGERGRAVGNPPKDSDQDRAIKVIGGELALAKPTRDKGDVRETGSLRLCLSSGQHSGLDV
nr:hypothetical protein [Thiorhodococcus mannitoliphagus]